MPSLSAKQLLDLHKVIARGVLKLQDERSAVTFRAGADGIGHFIGSVMGFYIELARAAGFSDERIAGLVQRGLSITPRLAPVDDDDDGGVIQ